MLVRCAICRPGSPGRHDCPLRLSTQVTVPALRAGFGWDGVLAGAWCVAGMHLVVMKFPSVREVDIFHPRECRGTKGTWACILWVTLSPHRLSLLPPCLLGAGHPG